jgi:hypothetical protein
MIGPGEKITIPFKLEFLIKYPFGPQSLPNPREEITQA